MKKTIIPKNYKPILDQYEIQKAIHFIRNTFQSEISDVLGLQRVSAPLFVFAESGLNDDLSGFERPVSFDIPELNADAQVVHSLAKWKRKALKDYKFNMYEGLFTNMNAIRRDEELDNIHSIYVDQWDWERIISEDDCNEEFLMNIVQSIVNTICNVNHLLKSRFPQLKTSLTRKVTFITSQELEDTYPSLLPEEREKEFAKIHKTIFVMKIGDKLNSGEVHGNRAPDYDNWELNGDIIFWNEVLEDAFEISSMGIRVDKETLISQLEKADCMYRTEFPFHKSLINGELPQTIGGGIGQSRLCMLLIGTAHIGEVQSSLWDSHTIEECKKSNIILL